MRGSVDTPLKKNKLQDNISKTFYSPREQPKSSIFDIDKQKIQTKSSAIQNLSAAEH